MSMTTLPQKHAKGDGRRAVVAGVVGNVLEWYDFAIYALLVPVMSALFFASEAPAIAVLLSLAVLGSGFLMRPIGAIVFGIMGDRRGRKATLTTVILIMAIATGAIGLLPTFDSIGLWAPVLLVALRLAQGFSTGGEWGAAGTFIIEHAPANRRGYFGGWHTNGVVLGILLGSATIFVLTRLISPENMSAWGWRVPFLLGAVIAFIGLAFRLRIKESPSFVNLEESDDREQTPLRTMVRKDLGAATVAFGIVVFQAIGTWLLLTWIVTYFTVVLGIDLGLASLMNMAGLAAFAIAVPLFGRLSDSVGRRPVLLAGAILTLVALVPAFLIMQLGVVAAVVAYCVLLILFAIYVGPMPATLVEQFPASRRTTGLSVSYNLAQVVFGGFAPFIAQLLVTTTGIIWSPTWYLALGAILSLIAVVALARRDKARAEGVRASQDGASSDV